MYREDIFLVVEPLRFGYPTRRYWFRGLNPPPLLVVRPLKKPLIIVCLPYSDIEMIICIYIHTYVKPLFFTNMYEYSKIIWEKKLEVFGGHLLSEDDHSHRSPPYWNLTKETFFLWVKLNSKSNCKNCQLRVLGMFKIK